MPCQGNNHLYTYALLLNIASIFPFFAFTIPHGGMYSRESYFFLPETPNKVIKLGNLSMVVRRPLGLSRIDFIKTATT